MSDTEVFTLLSQVKTISGAYHIVATNTGENFNIFQILGMETAEVKTHSKILAELLNPSGSHQQGDVFLKLFSAYFNSLKSDDAKFLEEDIALVTANGKLQIERFLGKKKDSDGGRMDISIEDTDGNFICIENKINAGEQDKQMLRYNSFSQKYKRSHLFF